MTPALLAQLAAAGDVQAPDSALLVGACFLKAAAICESGGLCGVADPSPGAVVVTAGSLLATFAFQSGFDGQINSA